MKELADEKMSYILVLNVSIILPRKNHGCALTVNNLNSPLPSKAATCLKNTIASYELTQVFLKQYYTRENLKWYYEVYVNSLACTLILMEIEPSQPEVKICQ